MADVLSSMTAAGASYYGSVDVSIKDGDLSSLFFKYNPSTATNVALPCVAISLNMNDRIRIITPPQISSAAFKPALTEAIRRHWPRGVYSEREYHGSHEWRLRGSPWWAHGALDAVDSRRLVNALVGAMDAAGWVLAASLDLSKKNSDKSSLFFCPRPPAQPITATPMSVGFHSNSLVRLIQMPVVAHERVRQAIEAGWPAGYKVSRGENYIEFKLNGHPWRCQGFDTVHARSLCLHIFDALLALGYTVNASVDVSAKTEGNDDDQWPADVHSWFLRTHAPGETIADAQQAVVGIPVIPVDAEAMRVPRAGAAGGAMFRGVPIGAGFGEAATVPVATATVPTAATVPMAATVPTAATVPMATATVPTAATVPMASVLSEQPVTGVLGAFGGSMPPTAPSGSLPSFSVASATPPMPPSVRSTATASARSARAKAEEGKSMFNSSLDRAAGASVFPLLAWPPASLVGRRIEIEGLGRGRVLAWQSMSLTGERKHTVEMEPTSDRQATVTRILLQRHQNSGRRYRLLPNNSV
jgi:hypothetical protein